MSRCTVLAYHAVGTCDDDPNNLFVTPEAFARQLSHLARHCHVVSLSDALRGEVPAGRRGVAITFDDGYRNVLRAAGPLLRAHGFPATVFVPTGWIGDRNRWDQPSTCALDIMDADELAECEASDIRIESHGHQHIDMAACTEDEVRTDLLRSKALLEEATGRSPVHLAYPYGRRSPVAAAVAAEVGFEAAFTIDRPGTGTYDYERVQVTPLDSDALFRIKTSGRYLKLRFNPVLEASRRAARSLIRR